MPELGVNIDHVATIRQARKTYEPDPVTAAAIAELAGADVITVHLREDRRHIQDRDVRVLRETVAVPELARGTEPGFPGREPAPGFCWDNDGGVARLTALRVDAIQEYRHGARSSATFREPTVAPPLARARRCCTRPRGRACGLGHASPRAHGCGRLRGQTAAERVRRRCLR